MEFLFQGNFMEISQSFGQALKKARKSKKITQEDFSQVSSRTYISTLERGIYTPTLEKIDSIAEFIGVHPLTLVTLTYLIENKTKGVEDLFELVRCQLKQIAEIS
jgi:transcriptional regulator with XRE-family HTH domain